MIEGERFKIVATSEIEGKCKRCSGELTRLFQFLTEGVVLICPDCEIAYELKLIKIPKSRIDKEELNGIIKEIKERRKN